LKISLNSSVIQLVKVIRKHWLIISHFFLCVVSQEFLSSDWMYPQQNVGRKVKTNIKWKWYVLLNEMSLTRFVEWFEQQFRWTAERNKEGMVIKIYSEKLFDMWYNWVSKIKIFTFCSFWQTYCLLS
jgi:hypothetical protein